MRGKGALKLGAELAFSTVFLEVQVRRVRFGMLLEVRDKSTRSSCMPIFCDFVSLIVLLNFPIADQINISYVQNDERQDGLLANFTTRLFRCRAFCVEDSDKGFCATGGILEVNIDSLVVIPICGKPPH